MVKGARDKSEIDDTDNKDDEPFKLEPLSSSAIDNVLILRTLIERVTKKVNYETPQIVSQHDGYSKLLKEIDHLRHDVHQDRGGGKSTEEIVVGIAALCLQYALDQCQYIYD